MLGIALHDNYTDLLIWSIWALLNALIALIVTIVKKQDKPVTIESVEKKPLLGRQVSTELIEGPVVPCPVNFNAPDLDASIRRMASLLRGKKWNEADACCERMLDQNFEVALPYIGKLMAERQVDIPEHLSWCEQPIECSENYQEAVKYANDEISAFLEKCNAVIYERKQKEQIEVQYQTCLNAWRVAEKMKLAERIENLEIVANQIDTLGDYKDSKKKLAEYRNTIKQCYKKKKERRCIRGAIVFGLCAIMVILVILLIPKIEERHAMKLIDEEKYDKAYGILTRIGKQDRVKDNVKERAISAMGKGGYSYAYSLLSDIGDYQTLSELAVAYAENFHHSATAVMTAFEPYKVECISDADVGDMVVFGNYCLFSDTDYHYPIQWIVLEKNDSGLLLLSKQAIEKQAFEWNSYKPVDWEDCSLNVWLNEAFLLTAFTSQEINLILQPNTDNKAAEKIGKVFLLSVSEVKRYKTISELKEIWQCLTTDYASKRYGENDSWLLRSLGISEDFVAYVDSNGEVHEEGNSQSYGMGVRPAIWITIP